LNQLFNTFNNLVLLLKTKLTPNSTNSYKNMYGKLDADYSTQSKSFYTILTSSLTTDGILSFLKIYSINF